MAAVYLDNNATTPVSPGVVEAMRPFWREQYGNASSLHGQGQVARRAVDHARSQVASLIGAQPRDVVFTSGGTESNHLAIRGALAATDRRRVVTTAVEHPAVYDLCRQLAAEGLEVEFVGVDPDGNLDLARLDAAVDDRTAIVSVMHANNETGVMFPVERVAAICGDRGVPLHVDAVQTAGKMRVDVAALGAALVTLSAHKMHGPKGAGALVVRPGTRIRACVAGGHQERDLRPGTENVPAIVGFGVAADEAARRLAAGDAHIKHLRDRLESTILGQVPFARVIGVRSPRVSNTTNIAFDGLQSEALLIALNEAGVCAGAGSACSSGALEPSHVLDAMGISDESARGAVRFSLSTETAERDIDRAVEIIPAVALRLASRVPNEQPARTRRPPGP